MPKKVKEDEFWRNYFYRVNLIKQSFDLKDLETSTTSLKSNENKKEKAGIKKTKNKSLNEEDDVNNMPA